jgi:3-methyladenine DNA glycosylase AlkC
MEPLKEMFNLAFYKRLSAEFGRADQNFNQEKFVKDVTKDMQDLSLNQRMRNTSVVLRKYLPADYVKSLDIMKSVIPNMYGGYTNLLFPDFVGLYGHDDKNLSLDALAYFTRFGSSEFAIREFLKRDFKATIKVMEKWANDKNEHVRRLASEGSRPRLPWSFKLDEVIRNPASTRNILEKLRSDDALYVRKSVANHLNDFSKDSPDYMLELVGAWDRSNTHTAWIVKHACRTLIKKGHVKTLGLFDFNNKIQVDIKDFKVNKEKLHLGDTLAFEFDLVSTSKKTQKLAVDYCIHYYKKTQGLSPKVFKLKEIDLGAGDILHIAKKQVFKDFTTRKHYAGKHVLEVIVNGNILAKQVFELLV